jgi:hypothetical protein
MEYTYENIHTENPRIYLTIDGKTVEAPMLYTDGGIDFTKSKKAVLGSWEMHLGAGHKHFAYRQEHEGNEWRDDVYMNGQLIRQDINISTDAGSAIVDQLEAGWDGFIPNYRTRSSNLVSEFSPVRPPYTNDSISFYEQNPPSDALISQFELDYESYLPWYGLKFDKVDNSNVSIKVVLQSGEMHRAHADIAEKIESKIPVWGNHFFAVIYNSDNEMNENVDVYFHASYDVVREWAEPGLRMPHTENSYNDNLWIWGAVYNTTSNEITHLKSYIRYYEED